MRTWEMVQRRNYTTTVRDHQSLASGDQRKNTIEYCYQSLLRACCMGPVFFYTERLGVAFFEARGAGVVERSFMCRHVRSTP